MRLVHFFYLVLELIFECLDKHVVVLFELILRTRSTLLQLLEGNFEFALRFNQVFLVIFFLVLKELAFTFPKCFVFVVHGLQVGDLPLKLLLLSLELHHLLGLRVAVVQGLTRA